MSFANSIKEVPFFRILTPFLIGISCQYWFDILSNSWWCYLATLVFLSMLFAGYYISRKWHYRWVYGLILSGFIFFSGALITLKRPISERIELNASNQAILKLMDNSQANEKSVRVEAELVSIYSKGVWWDEREKILAYFDLNDSLAVKLSYGDLIAVDLTPREVVQLGNPEQFNFKKYLLNKGIRLTTFLKKGDWILIDYNGNPIKKYALRLRDRLVLMFERCGLKGEELAVASALTLGYQNLIDDELRQVYSSSGAMHILSVSGLHVGVLYLLLSFMLKFLDAKTATRALKALILLCFLWFFALLTGIPPCVQRSALMFSFLVIGDFFVKKTNIYNTLASSAFVLLVMNPYNLFDVGFQLSYLAVLSIVFFYPYIYKLLYVKNWALDKAWSLIAVSIAAQLGTLSLTIFYFGQFPNYFLLSNLIAIPLSTIALYLAVLLVIVSPVNVISCYVGKVLSLTISGLNHGLEMVEKLPYSVTSGLSISFLQAVILFTVTLILAFYLLTKRGRFVLIGLSSFAVFLSLNIVSKLETIEKKEMVVYNVGRKSLVSFRVGESLVFIDIDTSKASFNEKYEFYTKNYISKVAHNSQYEVLCPFRVNDLKISNYLSFWKKNGVSVFNFNGSMVAIPFDKELLKISCGYKLDVDYLVVTNFFKDKMFDFFRPKLVIIDSSLPRQRLSEIVALCRKKRIPCYSVASQGAYVEDFNS